MGKYQRYDKQYNKKTADAAVNSNRRWLPAEEARLVKTWCRATASPAARIHVARILGRTYVACLKRHAYLHQRRGSWSGCKADPRRRVS